MDTAGSIWSWHPHVSVWVVMSAVLALYATAVRVWGPRAVSVGDPPVEPRQVRLFALGVLSMWIAADWPVHDMAERYLFSVHMGQHMVFSLVAAPLLLMGTPDWLARKILSPRPIRAVMRRVGRPIPALLIFNAYLVLSHWPAFVNFTVTHELAHFSAHSTLMLVSVIMWWPVLSPLPEMPRTSTPAQMLYLFGQTIVPTVPASFLTFAETPLYAAYAKAPHIFPGFDPITDQRVAGLLMKVVGGLYLWAVIAVLFFRWSSREESGTPDPVEWQVIERQLNQTGSKD